MAAVKKHASQGKLAQQDSSPWSQLQTPAVLSSTPSRPWPAPAPRRLAVLAILPLLADLLVLLLDHREQLLLLVQEALLLHLLLLDHLQQDGVVQHLCPAGLWHSENTVRARAGLKSLGGPSLDALNSAIVIPQLVSGTFRPEGPPRLPPGLAKASATMAATIPAALLSHQLVAQSQVPHITQGSWPGWPPPG